MTYATPLEKLAQHVRQQPNEPFLHQPKNRQLTVYSWKQVDDMVRRVASGLKSLGLERGDRVAIYGKNSAEWFVADWAIMMAGMISVPVYATAGAPTLKYIMEHSGSKAVFIGKLDDFAPAKAVLDGTVPRIAFPYETPEADHQWSDWVQQQTPFSDDAHPSLDDTMTIVYTSGSTGDPKGVVLTFRNFASVSETNSTLFKMQTSDRVISYLPLAHITERGVIEGPALYAGSKVYFVESLDTFLDDLKTANPTLFLSVPRLWTRFQVGVFEKMPQKKLAKLLRIPLLGKLVAKKVRTGLGLNSARLFGSGSAPISKGILEWYHSIGVPISEGWGMTETTGLSCSNIPFQAGRLGTIGQPIACVEMKLSDENEILIRGDAVFEHYYNNPEATAAAFTDGWFHTGDKAELIADGAFKIVGRLKEEFKTAKGKYVAPVPIESLLAADPDIEQICVMGLERKQPVAVVVLAEHLTNAQREPIRQSIMATLEKVNADLERHQKVDGVIVTQDAWTIENEMLTPTLKIKRSVLENRYRELAGSIETQAVIWEDEIA